MLISSTFFLFLCSQRWFVHRQEEEDDLHRLLDVEAREVPLQSMPSLSPEAGIGCGVEAHWSAGQDLVPEPWDEIQEGAKAQKPGSFTVSCCAVLRTVWVFQALKNLPPRLQSYAMDCPPTSSCLFASDANGGQRIPSSHLPHLSCTLTSVANGPSTSTQGGESHHRAGVSNRPQGFLMVVPSVLIKILNDTSTFTHLWKTGGCLISAPGSKIPEHVHEAF